LLCRLYYEYGKNQEEVIKKRKKWMDIRERKRGNIVDCPCNLSYSGGRDQEHPILWPVLAQKGTKTDKMGMVSNTFGPSYAIDIGRITVRGCPCP
jgi:hypothetical protein